MTRPRRRPARRPSCAFDPLESRTLLSVGTGPPDLLVKFHDGVSEAAETRLLKAVRGIKVDTVGDAVDVVDLKAGGTAAALRRLRSSPLVDYAEPNRTLKTAAFTPSDPFFAVQWGLSTPNNVDIDAPTAWTAMPGGGPPTVVAVVDTGIDFNHPDLASQIWTNPFEIPGNGLDDDRNGYVDDIQGWNFVDNSNRPTDDSGHGSHISGIIAAASNGSGTVGVNPNARIMPLKFLDSLGDGSIANAVEAIHYAVRNGARVINASWSGPTASPALADAIRFAWGRGVVVVEAAGNESSNNDKVAVYPSAYRLPNTLSVAALAPDGRLAGFSNFGKKSVDIAAPGVSILSTWTGGGYRVVSGTSMATPFVSGVVSLLVAQNPAQDAASLVRRVTSTARPLASLKGKVATSGLVDADNAVLAIPQAASANGKTVIKGTNARRR